MCSIQVSFGLTIQPWTARGWLKLYGNVNKAINQPLINQLCNALYRGEWFPDPNDPIIIGRDGTIHNGTQRLMAIGKANISAPGNTVVWNWDERLGLLPTTADVLLTVCPALNRVAPEQPRIEEPKPEPWETTSFTIHYRAMASAIQRIKLGVSKQTPEQSDAFLAAHPRLRRETYPFVHLRARGPLLAAGAAALVHGVPADDVARFVGIANTGAGVQEDRDKYPLAVYALIRDQYDPARPDKRYGKIVHGFTTMLCQKAETALKLYLGDPDILDGYKLTSEMLDEYEKGGI